MSTAIHIELDALCLLLLYAIAHQSQANVNQQMKRVLFRCLVYGAIAQLILDILWLIVEGSSFPGAVIANRVINALFLSAGIILGCILYLYVLETMGYRITRRLQTLVMLPGLLFLGLNVISIWTEWVFTVSPENIYAHGPLFWLQIIGAYGMMLLPLAHLIIFLVSHRNSGRRDEERVSLRPVRTLLSFFFVPVVGAVITLFYTGMPGTWTSAAISLVLLYIDDQDSEIIRDGLTGLNNRKTLEGAFNEYVKQEQNNLYLFLMDLDSFKQINDTFGHPVGDQALVTAANILSSSMVNRKGILVRYGGDEFLVMGFFDAAQQESDSYKSALQKKFADYRHEQNLPYKFSISIGAAKYAPGKTLESLVKEADNELYKEK